MQRVEKLFTRFYEWVMHPAVRNTDGVAKNRMAFLRNFPTDGSSPEPTQTQDYRTPFSESRYNVRFSRPTQWQLQPQQLHLKVVGNGIDPIRKLVLLKFLDEKDTSNEQAVAEARKKFKAAYGKEVEDPVLVNDLQLGLPAKYNRQTIRSLVEEGVKASQQSFKQQQPFMTAYDRANKPSIMQFNSLDLYDDPDFQQMRVEAQYRLDEIAAENVKLAKEGQFEIMQGNKKFWKAIDDSHDTANIAKVQGAVGDEAPLDFSLPSTKVKFDFDKDGNVTDIHRIVEK